MKAAFKGGKDIFPKVLSICRPLIIRIFPYRFLRYVKGRMVDRNYRKIAEDPRLPFVREAYTDGINLIGDIRAASGLGQSCRLLADVLMAASFPADILYYDTLGGDHSVGVSGYEKFLVEEPKYNINLIHVNPAELGIAYMRMDRKFWDRRYNIGYWLWELEEFPDKWLKCFECVDEIWAPSEFICNAVRKKTSLPVTCVPYHIRTSRAGNYKREDYGLPDGKFLFLMMYDSASCAERKNPVGTIRAFKQAFSENEDNVGLVIKVSHCRESDRKMIRAELGGYKNVYLITETYPKGKVNGLINACDVIVSLHRAEGFGLVLAEAMLLGKATIATDYSANIEFMNKEAACMVDYEMVTLKEDALPFEKGDRWAEPDIGQAADYMKRLYEDREYYRRIADAGKAYAKEKLREERIRGIIEDRIAGIYESRRDKTENQKEEQ